MTILRIQHSVQDFESWRRAFDADPLDRRGSGVRRYVIHRGIEDRNFVMVDLEFDTVDNAERMLEKLRRLWAGPGGAIARNPEAWVFELVESVVPA